ncbi:Chaperone protein DnaJ [Spironucleus salmonicida]|uniref:Chaperone protein DnaJ n=1 Tax=Spironucleus salmonicida TaxID=348837 RepID=V6LST3_9EUKA|nr:Chaperone protein DnaJ [Spironucleus salmonicida]|eukprot:EST47697.1 Chaperone protein DnaJ [Spironucleus salmonicida]
MLVIFLQVTALERAEQAMKSKNYPEAIKQFDIAEKSDKLSPTNLFFRGTAKAALHQPKPAISDFVKVIKQTQSQNLKIRSQEKLFEICQSNCQLNCYKEFTSSMFQSNWHYSFLQQMTKDRKILLQGGYSNDDLINFAQKCSRDPEIQLKVITVLLEQQQFAQCKDVTDRLKIVFQDKRQECSQLSDIFELLRDSSIGNYDNLEKVAIRASRSQPDESIYTNFYKIAKVLKELSAEIEKFAPTQKLSADTLSPLLKKVKKIQAYPQKLFTSLNTRIQFLTSKIFNIDEELIPVLNFENMQYKVQNQVDSLIDIINLISSGTSQIIVEDLPSDTPHQKYIKAILYYFELDINLKSIVSAYQKKEDFGILTGEADKKINFVYALLRDAYKLKVNDNSFPHMQQFITDLNKLSDSVFNYHMKTLNPDIYKILNVSRQSSDSDIRKSYFKMARKYHPDMVAKNTTEEEKKSLARQFQRIADAYDIISDPKKRTIYNQGQHNAQERQSAEQYHQQRKQLAQQMFYRQQQRSQGQGQDFGGFDPFQFFNGGQQQGQQQGGRQRVVFNYNGQNVYM